MNLVRPLNNTLRWLLLPVALGVGVLASDSVSAAPPLVLKGDARPGPFERRADPRRVVLERKKARVTSRYDVIKPNEAIVRVVLPDPWKDAPPKLGEPDFGAAQDAAWKVLLDAITAAKLLASSSGTKGEMPSENSIEIFERSANIFKIHGLTNSGVLELRRSPGIAYAAKKPRAEILSTAQSPQIDLIHPNQINLENPGGIQYLDLDGEVRSSRADVDVDILKAWEGTIGSSNVVVAVIDDAFNIEGRPELEVNIYSNAKEIPCNGVDDDRNGYIDDYRLYDAVEKTGCPKNTKLTGHGTSMALTLAAPPRIAAPLGSAERDRRITGVAPAIRYLPIAIGADVEHGLHEAYRYILAVKERGVPIRVVNISIGQAHNFDFEGPVFDGCSTVGLDGLPTDIGRLIRSGVTVVAAAGNEGINNDRYRVCPSCLAEHFDSVISVAAVDPAGNHPFYSNYGERTVTTSAPGTAIYTGYSFRTGTSPAAVHVSGIAALMYSANPSLTAAEVKKIILESTKLTSLGLPVKSRGIVSAALAVQKAVQLKATAIKAGAVRRR